MRRHERLVAENAALRRQLADQRERGRALDEQLLGLNQRRQDAIKRIDDLVAQIQLLEGQADGSGE